MLTQEVVIDFPPNYEDLVEVFDLIPRQGVIFSWGPRLFNPDGVTIAPALLAHEAVHGERQLGDIEGWWLRYVDSIPFRLEEELRAHQAEYRHLLQHGNRGTRRRALKQTAARLAAPLYGPMCSESEARQWLRTPRFVTRAA